MGSEAEQDRAPPAGWGRPARAAFLMLIQPAVGMLYLGLPRLALLAWFLNAAILPLTWIVPETLLAIVLVFVLTTVGGLALAVFAAIWARRHPTPPRGPWWRWYGLLAAYVVALALSPIAWLGVPVHNYRIPSRSMLPTLRVGEYVLAAALSRPSSATVGPGDVVMFPLPRDPSVDYVKRVVAMGGDTVQMRRGILQINGAPVHRERVPDIAVPADAGDASASAQVCARPCPTGAATRPSS